MSNNIAPLKTYRYVDPIVDVNQPREYVIKEGGSINSYIQIQSSSASNSNVVWQVKPPSTSIVVDSKIYMVLNGTITFTGPSTNTTPIIGYVANPEGTKYIPTGTDGFRRFPLSACISSLTATINNVSSTVQINNFVDALTRYNTYMDDNQFVYSTGPNMPDQAQHYYDLTGGNKNPLVSYADGAQYSNARGNATILVGAPASNVYTSYMLTAPTPTSATIYFYLCEPLFVSPITFGRGEGPGFIGINNLQINLNFGDLTRIWSHDNVNGQTISNITVNIQNNNQLLLMHYITPPQGNLFNFDQYIYPYYSLTDYITTLNATPPKTAVASAISSNIQLSFIPERIYVFLKRSLATETYYTSDAYAQINNISINWNNLTAQLSSATPFDLYKISVKNGCKLTWDEWMWNVGSVLCLELGSDISLGPGEAPGLGGQWNLQMTIGAYNMNGYDTINYEIHIVTVTAGTMTIFGSQGGTSLLQLGVITEEDILNSPNLPSQVKAHGIPSIYGGSFFSGLKNIFNKIKQGVESAKPYLKPALNVAETLIPGSNVAIEPVKAALGLGRRKARGGKALPRDELRTKLKKYYG